jgi:hypothetical protein
VDRNSVQSRGVIDHEFGIMTMPGEKLIFSARPSASVRLAMIQALFLLVFPVS